MSLNANMLYHLFDSVKNEYLSTLNVLAARSIAAHPLSLLALLKLSWPRIKGKIPKRKCEKALRNFFENKVCVCVCEERQKERIFDRC